MEYREGQQGRSKGKSRQPLTFEYILAYECQIEVFVLFFSFNVILHRNSNEEKSKKSSRGVSINDNGKFDEKF